MKTRIAFAAITIMIVVAQIFAQEVQPAKKFTTKEARYTFAKKNVMLGLHSNNNGVIESAMMLIAKIKMSEPSLKVTELQYVLDSLSVAHPSGAMRYKAFLTSNICSNPEWYSQENTAQTNEPEAFFIAVSQSLQKKMFGMNSL